MVIALNALHATLNIFLYTTFLIVDNVRLSR